MTTTRSHSLATRPMSWVVSNTAAPLRRALSRSPTTCAWVVTSSAVVGSSAMSSLGSLAIPTAIITRWRIPPESWWGRCSARCSASAMPLPARSGTTRATASCRPNRRWALMASSIWVRTRSRGFSALVASWKDMATSSPRSRRRSSGSRAITSCPSTRIRPATMRPGSGTRRSTESPSIVLPQPDSPTRPTISPAATCRLAPSTARTRPSGVGNCVCKPSTSRTCPIDAYRLRRGSRASRSPSPMKLHARVASEMATAGATTWTGWAKIAS